MKILNALTFDVEDWYQVTAFDDVLNRESWASQEYRLDRSLGLIFKILNEYGVKATFFVLGKNLEAHPEIVTMIAEQGHEIGTHGTSHHLIYNQTPEEFRSDVRESLERIRALTDAPVTGYRAPSLSITKRSLWALDILCEFGFEYDSSIIPISRELNGIPDADPFPGLLKSPGGREIMEFPITARGMLGRMIPFCGGAYFRLCPLTLMKRWIGELNRQGHPAIVYLHPWELDPAHPVIPGKKWRSFHYVNLKSTENKLRGLLKAFEFGPARQVLFGNNKRD